MKQKWSDHPKFNFKIFLKATISAQLHLFGFLAAFIGFIVLLNYSSDNSSAAHFWACFLFGLTSLVVFGASTVYHLLSDGYEISPKLYGRLKKLDHFSIYLFIAGTYTPFLLNAVAPPWSLILLGVIWSCALIGILYTHYKTRLPQWAQHRAIYTGIFVLMGWALVVRIGEVFKNISSLALGLLVAGGVSYTLGAIVYASKRPRLIEGVFGFHEIWHIMVLLGAGFHYFMILSFYI